MVVRKFALSRVVGGTRRPAPLCPPASFAGARAGPLASDGKDCTAGTGESTHRTLSLNPRVCRSIRTSLSIHFQKLCFHSPCHQQQSSFSISPNGARPYHAIAP